ncbi:MAG: hypothetical protein KF743_12200 [Fimbriimonadaceae bacterium]|nr:hypothetical protein [Fimbriimonadaceae bacterium]
MSDSSAPINPEAWLSYVMALQSLRSTNAGQHEFGARLMELVFRELPERYKHDSRSTAYFDGVLAEVAWAVRGFSVVRDIFQRNVQAQEQCREAELRHVESLRRLAPFSSDSVWGKVKGSLLGIGVAAPLIGLAVQFFGATTPVWLIGGAAVIATGLLAMEFFVAGYVHRRLKAIQAAAPEEVMTTWQIKAMAEYRLLAEVFLRKVDLVEARHYRNSSEPNLKDADVEEILTRAFILQSKR